MIHATCSAGVEDTRPVVMFQCIVTGTLRHMRPEPPVEHRRGSTGDSGPDAIPRLRH